MRNITHPLCLDRKFQNLYRGATQNTPTPDSKIFSSFSLESQVNRKLECFLAIKIHMAVAVKLIKSSTDVLCGTWICRSPVTHTCANPWNASKLDATLGYAPHSVKIICRQNTWKNTEGTLISWVKRKIPLLDSYQFV